MDRDTEAVSVQTQLKAARNLWLEILGFIVSIIFVGAIGLAEGFSRQYLIFAGFFIGIYILTLAVAYFRLLHPTLMTPRALEDRALRSVRAGRRERP